MFENGTRKLGKHDLKLPQELEMDKIISDSISPEH